MSHMMFNEEQIDIVDQFKYLGVVLDGPLKFKPHVDYLVRKITPKVKTLSKIRGYVCKGTALYLFNSLIAPVFSFNEHIYDGMGVVESNRLQTLHNGAYTKVSASHSQSTRASVENKLAIPSHRLECCKGNILT